MRNVGKGQGASDPVKEPGILFHGGKKVSGSAVKGVELKELNPEPVPSASRKVPESESGREKAILMKVKENRETGSWEEEESEASDPVEVKVDVIGGKERAMTFPEVVDQVRAKKKMGNVRRSSACGTPIKKVSTPVSERAEVSAQVGVENEDGEGQAEGMGEVERMGQAEVVGGENVVQELEEREAEPGRRVEEVGGMERDEEVIRVRNGAVQRRHSTGNSVNRAHLLAIIRRLQQRRFRPPTQSIAVKYIQYFMAFLYYVGISPLQPKSAMGFPKWLTWTQFIFFWLFTGTSVLQSLGDTKYTWVLFREEENMLTFVTFGFFLGSSLIRIYHVKLFATSAASTSALLRKIDRVNNRRIPKKGGWARTIAITVGTFALLLSGLSTLFADIPLRKWSFRKAMLFRSYELSEYIFVWTSHDYGNVSDQLREKYGVHLTAAAEWFAAVGSWLNFFGTLHSCLMLDLWPIVAIQIFILQCHFNNAMEKTKRGNRGGRCPLSIHWRHYMELRDVCDETHEIFGKLIKQIHLLNILLYSYFLLQLLKKEPISISLLIDLASVIKVSITYFIVQRSADKNEKCKECVVQCSRRLPTIEMDGIEVSVAVLLKDMNKHPIGVGRGEFFVDEAFILKLAATVGSIFLLLSDESGEKCNCTISQLNGTTVCSLVLSI